MKKIDHRKEIFTEVRTLMKKYEPPFAARGDSRARYELWSEKEVEAFGRKRKDLFFASVIIKAGYVGLYFMPVYVDAKIGKLFGKELLATLKGMSCFHLTAADPKILQQIRRALAIGFRLYKKKGWV